MKYFSGQPHRNKVVIAAAMVLWAGVAVFLVQHALAAGPVVDSTIAPTSLTGTYGQTLSATYTLSPSIGYDAEEADVTIDCPAGTTCLLDGKSQLSLVTLPYGCKNGGSDCSYSALTATLTIATTSSTPQNATVRVTYHEVSSDRQDEVSTVSLAMQDFTLNGGGAQGVTLTPGDATSSFDVQIQSQNGLTGDIQLSVVGLPQGTSVVWEDGGSDTVSLPTGSTVGHKHFHLQTSTSTPAGTATYHVQGILVGGSLTNSTADSSFTVNDFMLNFATMTQTVEQGKRTGNYAIQVGGANDASYSGPVTLSVGWDDAVPQGVQYYWNGASTAADTFTVTLAGPNQLPTLAIDVPASVPVQDFHFHIQGVSQNGQTHVTPDPKATMTVVAAGSGFTLSDIALNVVKETGFVTYPGDDSKAYTIWATAQNNFTGIVTFAVSWLNGAPSGVSTHWDGVCSDNRTLSCTEPDGRYVDSACGTCSGRDTTSITFNQGDAVLAKALYFSTGSDTQPGTYPFTVTATYGSGTTTYPSDDSLTFVVSPRPPADFSITPYSLYNPSINQGSSGTFTININSDNGFNEPVTLTADTGDSNIGVTFNPDVPTPPADQGVQSVMTISVGATVPCGSKTITVTGTSPSGLTHQLLVRITVCAPGFSVTTVSPATLALNTNSSGSYTVTVARTGGYTGDLTVSWTVTPDPAGQIGFSPASGSLKIPDGQTTGTIAVTTYANPVSSYALQFSVTDGTTTQQYSQSVALTTNVACSIPDTPAPLGACNDSSCYDGNGQLRCPLQDKCYSDAPKCQNYKVLKVRKDRECNQWLDCKSTITVVNAQTGKNQDQCTELGVCVTMGTDGRCSQFLTGTASGQQPANRTFQTPDQVQGVTSKIRMYSGYSTGFHFFQDPINPNGHPSISGGFDPTDVAEVGLSGGVATDLVQNGTFEQLQCSGGPRDRKSCIVASDCRIGTGTCVQYAEGDVSNRCSGDQNTVCSDNAPCPAGKGTCAPPTFDAFTEAGLTSNAVCTNDKDCADIKSSSGATPLPHCRYLSSWGSDVLCQNPLDSEWLGITPPSGSTTDDIEEAGYGYKASDATYDGDVRSGTRNAAPDNNGAEAELIKWRVWEDDNNFQKQTTTDGVSDPRYPGYAQEKHLKDGNNDLKVTLDAGAKSGSGIGVPLASKPTTGGNGYVLSMQYRSVPGTTPMVPLKAQFAFNYQARTTSPGLTKGYELTKDDASTYDIGTIAGPTVCSQDPATSCDLANDVCGTQSKGLCVDTSTWQQLTFGPVVIPSSVNFDQAKTALLQIVTTADLSGSVTFNLDNVSLKPALQIAQQDTPGTAPVIIPRSCRLFSRDDSPDCQYSTDDGSTFKGWRGYCLDKDPENADLCLTWWPLDVLAGENPLGSKTQANYSGLDTIYQCLEQPAENGVADAVFADYAYKDYREYDWSLTDGTFTTEVDKIKGSATLSASGYCAFSNSRVCTVDKDCTDYGVGPCVHNTVPKATIRWRDLVAADLFFTPYDTSENSPWTSSCASSVTGGSEFCPDPTQRVYHFYLDKVNRVAGDNGIRLFVAQNADAASASSKNWNPPSGGDNNSGIWRQNDAGDDCHDSDIGGEDDQYLAVLIHFKNFDTSNAKDTDKIIDHVQIKICDDKDHRVDGGDAFRMVLRARSSCNYIAQTVSKDADNDGVPEQKAWGPRMQPGAYLDPKLSISYDTDAAPYGAIKPVNKSLPTTWSWKLSDGFGVQPSLEEADPRGNYTNLRAGISYSYDSDPKTIGVSSAPKYCFDSTAAVNTQSGNTFDANNLFNFNTQSTNTCSTPDQKTACLTERDDVCSGRPVKHCSGNQFTLCTAEADCASKGFGSCTGSSDAGWTQPDGSPGVQGAADGAKRLQHVFAQSFGCWQLKTTLMKDSTDYTNNPSGCAAVDVGGCEVHSDYVNGCPLLNQTNSRSNAGVWDVVADKYKCPESGRPTNLGSNDDTEYCYVTPTVKNFTIGGATSGTISVDQNKSMTAQFSYSVDSQQAPTKQYVMEWLRPSGATDACGTNGAYGTWVPMPTGSTIVLSPYHYTKPGTYQPRLCVKDSWNVVGEAVYNGTITATTAK